MSATDSHRAPDRNPARCHAARTRARTVGLVLLCLTGLLACEAVAPMPPCGDRVTIELGDALSAPRTKVTVWQGQTQRCSGYSLPSTWSGNCGPVNGELLVQFGSTDIPQKLTIQVEPEGGPKQTYKLELDFSRVGPEGQDECRDIRTPLVTTVTPN